MNFKKMLANFTVKNCKNPSSMCVSDVKRLTRKSRVAAEEIYFSKIVQPSGDRVFSDRRVRRSVT